MNKTILRRVVVFAVALVVGAAANAYETAGGMFLIRTSAKTPEVTVTAIRRYVADKKWLYLAEFKVKNDQVTIVKLCVPAVSKDIWAAGIHVGAMGPCGNISVYREGGATRISMLHPKFMDALNPDPNLKKVGEELYPLFTAMLDNVTR